jgi:hypothetical protein
MVSVVTVRPVGARCHGGGVTQGSAPLHPGLSPCAALRRGRARDACPGGCDGRSCPEGATGESPGRNPGDHPHHTVPSPSCFSCHSWFKNNQSLSTTKHTKATKTFPSVVAAGGRSDDHIAPHALSPSRLCGFGALFPLSVRQTNKQMDGRKKPQSREAAKGSLRCDQCGTSGQSPPCKVPGRSPPHAPRGQPTAAQGNALRFADPEEDQSPERADESARSKRTNTSQQPHSQTSRQDSRLRPGRACQKKEHSTSDPANTGPR